MANVKIQIYKSGETYRAEFIFTNDIYTYVVQLMEDIFDVEMLNSVEVYQQDETTIQVTTTDENKIDILKKAMLSLYKAIGSLNDVCLN